MGPGEEPDEAIRIRFPDVEGEVDGLDIGLDIIVADEDGAGGDRFLRVEPEVEARRWLPNH